MDDQRLLKLVKAAVELEELEASVNLRSPKHPSMAQRRSATQRWVKVGASVLAVAAVLVIMVTRQDIAIEQMAVLRVPVRAPGADIEISLNLNRPAYLRVVLIDMRNERWIMPIGTRSEYVAQVPEQYRMQVPSAAIGTGAASRAAYVMIIASRRLTPTAEELLDAIPDPVAPSSVEPATVRQRLDDIAVDLEQTFDCAVRVEQIPP